MKERGSHDGPIVGRHLALGEETSLDIKTPLPTPTLVGPNSISREKEDKDWEETKMSSLQVFC